MSKPRAKSRMGRLGMLGVDVIALMIMAALFGKSQSDYFKEHRTAILAATQNDLHAGRYDAVITTAEKYSAVGDPVLRQLRDEAERLKDQQRVAAEHLQKQERLAALRNEISVEGDRTAKRRKVEELLSLLPNDTDAIRILAEINEIEEAERQQRIAKLRSEIPAENDTVVRRKKLGELLDLVPDDAYAQQLLAKIKEAEDKAQRRRDEAVSRIRSKQYDVRVSFLTVKQVDGKWRYFFAVHNHGTELFEGSVKINLVRSDGRTTSHETFEGSVHPGFQKVVYTDAHTGMSSEYGEYKISSFSFTVDHEGPLAPTGLPDPEPVEVLSPNDKAASKLRLAKQLLEKSKADGRKWLNEVVEEHPGTPAADEAAAMLLEFGE